MLGIFGALVLSDASCFGSLPAFSKMNLTSSQASEPENRRPDDSVNGSLEAFRLHVIDSLGARRGAHDEAR